MVKINNNSPRPFLLLVEDEPGIAELLEMVLSDEGYQIVVAANGMAALAELENDPARFKCLITDVFLGSGPTGWDVAKRARELVPAIPVVYMTGNRGGEWSVNNVPASIMVMKPFDVFQLVATVVEITRSQE